MNPELRKFPAAPEFNNSAGRLIALLEMVEGNQNLLAAVSSIYNLGPDTGVPIPRGGFGGGGGFGGKAVSGPQSRAFLDFAKMLGSAFDEFVNDVESSSSIPAPQRTAIKSGINRLFSVAYSVNPNQPIQKLEPAEKALLQMAGSMLEAEPVLEETDAEKVRNSIELLRESLEDSEISKSAKIAMLEVCRLSRNALDQYTIHGARGFKKAFKKMLSEMMLVFLDEGDEKAKTPWWKNAVSHIRVFDSLTAKLVQYNQLLGAGSKLFLTEEDL